LWKLLGALEIDLGVAGIGRARLRGGRGGGGGGLEVRARDVEARPSGGRAVERGFLCAELDAAEDAVEDVAHRLAWVHERDAHARLDLASIRLDRVDDADHFAEHDELALVGDRERELEERAGRNLVRACR
jgi:hypothetical protein